MTARLPQRLPRHVHPVHHQIHRPAPTAPGHRHQIPAAPAVPRTRDHTATAQMETTTWP